MLLIFKLFKDLLVRVILLYGKEKKGLAVMNRRPEENGGATTRKVGPESRCAAGAVHHRVQ